METLIEQYKKDQGNLPCKLAIACARPLSEAEVNFGNVALALPMTMQLMAKTIAMLIVMAISNSHCAQLVVCHCANTF